MKLSRFIVTMIALSLFTDAAASRTGLIETGRPFPEMSLPSADDGRPLSITFFRGEKVIVQVFASW